MEKEIREHPDDEKTEDPGSDPVEESGPDHGLHGGGDDPDDGSERAGEKHFGGRPEDDEAVETSEGDDGYGPVVGDRAAAESDPDSDTEPDTDTGTEPEPEPEPGADEDADGGADEVPEEGYREPVIDYGSLSGDDPSGEASFGTWLRRQREMREIDLRDIAAQTKISLRYLKAMEGDRFDVLPAPVFARGFLKEYSRYVGLNADEVVNYYLAAHQGGDGVGETADEEPVSMSTESRGPVSKTFLVALVLALLAAAVVYFYFYQRSNESHEEAQPPPIAAPAASPLEDLPAEPEQDEPADTRAAPLVVTLDFTQECWLEAQVDRSERTSKLFVAGESLQLEAEEIVVLENVGNVDGVQVQVNGEPFELPSSGSGATARDVIIDRDSFDTAAGPGPVSPSPPAGQGGGGANVAGGGGGGGAPAGDAGAGNLASGGQ